MIIVSKSHFVLVLVYLIGIYSRRLYVLSIESWPPEVVVVIGSAGSNGWIRSFSTFMRWGTGTDASPDRYVKLIDVVPPFPHLVAGLAKRLSTCTDSLYDTIRRQAKTFYTIKLIAIEHVQTSPINRDLLQSASVPQACEKT